jgi:histidinol dehydrogenase
MAFGTRTVPRVDRIVGPGNAFTTEAKALVSRVTGIDLLAGPSELLIIADDTAAPAAVAREMLAQAEHDTDVTVVAIVVGRDAEPLREVLGTMIGGYGRRDVIRDALHTRGGVLEAASVAEAVAFAADFAPEHLLLAVREPEVVLPLVRNAGMVFLGLESSVSFGDYATGANHVLPTGGLARSSSGLSTEHFVRWTAYQRVAVPAARGLALDVAALATAESLDGHARAAAAWGTGT